MRIDFFHEFSESINSLRSGSNKLRSFPGRSQPLLSIIAETSDTGSISADAMVSFGKNQMSVALGRLGRLCGRKSDVEMPALKENVLRRVQGDFPTAKYMP